MCPTRKKEDFKNKSIFIVNLFIPIAFSTGGGVKYSGFLIVYNFPDELESKKNW